MQNVHTSSFGNSSIICDNLSCIVCWANFTLRI